MTIALLLDIVTWQIAEMTGGRCYAFVCLWL
jgi:hypothetical protein